MPPRNTHYLHDFHEYGANQNSREIFLENHPDNGENPGVDYRTANSFIKNLRALDLTSNKDILVHLYSIGGEWNDCMAMFDAVRSCSSNVVMVSYAQAESSSSIILQSATTRVLMPRSYVMVHYGNSGYSGEYNNVHNWSDFEKKYVTEMMMDIYSERCCKGKFFKEKGYDQTQTKKYLYKKLKDGDWYLTPEDAVYYGFADGVLGSTKYYSLDSIISR